MSEDFESLLQKGYYTDRDLSQPEANSATSWIMKNIVAKKRSAELLHEWESIEKDLTDPYYLTLLYNGCLSIQYFYDSYEPKQTESAVVNHFCISMFKFLIKNDNTVDLSRLYWAKLAEVYHVLKEYDQELGILNEGIVKIYQVHKWEPGKMTDLEAKFVKYSGMETLLAQKAKCLHQIRSNAECRATLDLLYESLGVRGIEDMINGHFPNGLKQFYNNLV